MRNERYWEGFQARASGKPLDSNKGRRWVDGWADADRGRHPWHRESIARWAVDAGFTVDESEIRPGDVYLGGLDTGPHLLTCERVIRGIVHGWTSTTRSRPASPAWYHQDMVYYEYNLNECVKVTMSTYPAEFEHNDCSGGRE